MFMPSMTGLSPVIAAPMPIPTKPFSALCDKQSFRVCHAKKYYLTMNSEPFVMQNPRQAG